MIRGIALGLGARRIGGDPLFNSASLWWDFDQLNTVLVRGPGDPVPLSRPLSSFWTFTRASSATRVNASGVIESVGNNVPRLEFDPVTLQPRGLLMEGQRTNLLLNSLINGTNLATQSVTVTAVAHTLSFYGTGTVTLSGAHSATVVGTGAYPSRRTLTFTPSAGTLTCTVTGTVQFAQLEVGAFATSFIPTGASQVTRGAELALVTGTSFSDWYGASQGTFLGEGVSPDPGGLSIFASVNDATFNNRMLFAASTGGGGALVVNGGATQFNPSGGGTANTTTRRALAYQAANFAYARDGLAPTTGATGTIPTVTRLAVAAGVSGAESSVIIRRIRYWPTRLTNAQLQGITA